MTSFLLPHIRSSIVRLLVNSGLLRLNEAKAALDTSPGGQIKGDGSNRKFLRICHKFKSVCVVVIPAGEKKEDLAEAQSAWLIGNHLLKQHVPLPQLYGWDEETGILLFEDLGDIRLHDLPGLTHSWPQDQYFQVIDELVHMQYAGASNFSKVWCWDSPVYDRQLMLERESGYFLRAFWQGLLARQINQGVEEELKDIARRAEEAGAHCFLHRDFQCRNIMIKDGRVRFIDFQGGRMGPPGYDLASLLIDPYAGLSHDRQDLLLEYYLSTVADRLNIDREQFCHHYSLLSFQRNMQIVGAFAFLFKVRQKEFFFDYIQPALSALDRRLQEPQFSEYPIIRGMVKEGMTNFHFSFL